ncbi:MAG: hypothetical protein JWO06_4117 [Bacteroidota bacterium]|nr:hypothetical protein [Bacteroidota bacterium]
MKGTGLIRFLILSGLLPLNLFGTSCIQQGPDTIKTNTVITGGCIINGDLIIQDGTTLHVDLTGGLADTFIVRGNILLQGNAALFINADSGSTNAQFIVSNTSNNQRSITTQGTSRVILQYIEFRTQEGDLSSAGSYYMSYYAEDSSALSISNCRLDPQKAWLLCNLKNKSSLIAVEANRLPTEIYLQDTAQMSLQGQNTNVGVWLLFESTTDTLNLPDQTGPYYNWQVGRGFGGVSASQWFLNVDSAKPGLGVQVQPFAKLVVNGMGQPNTGEAHVNLLFANGTDTLSNLKTGLQNTNVARGRLILNNVNLGPIAWQLYAVSNETLHINNSIVNEIGVVGPSNHVTVDSSLIQLATLSGLGTTGSNLTLNNSEIWSQAIIAANTCHITLNNCKVTGSWFSTDGASDIMVNGGCFYQNPSGCTENTMVNINTGQPYCNPFIPGGFPQNLTPVTVTFNGVNSNCVTTIEDLNDNRQIEIYPNPFSTETKIQLEGNVNRFSLALYNALGQEVKRISDVSGSSIILNRNNILAGVYFIRLMEGNKTTVTAKVVIADN